MSDSLGIYGKTFELERLNPGCFGVGNKAMGFSKDASFGSG